MPVQSPLGPSLPEPRSVMRKQGVDTVRNTKGLLGVVPTDGAHILWDWWVSRVESILRRHPNLLPQEYMLLFCQQSC